MSNPEVRTNADTLGIRPGNRVRFIGDTGSLDTLLRPLPADVTVTSLASESADIGVIVIDDERDLRERLFTELDGLLGATQVWIVSRTGTGPSEDSIRTEADVVSWEAVTTVTLGDRWIAVALLKK